MSEKTETIPRHRCYGRLRCKLSDCVMSEFDVDIRAVSSASYGARTNASDVNQASGGSLDSSAAQVTTLQTSGSSGGDVSAPGQPQFRYDSFRFLYRADYGRIVLVDQDPQTGKAVAQIPSQRALQLYAEQKQSELRTTVSGSAGDGATGTNYQGSSTVHAAKGTGTTGSGAVAAASSATTKASTAPSVSIPSPAYLTQAFPPVNITI